MKLLTGRIVLLASACALSLISTFGCISITETNRETDLGTNHISVVPSCQNSVTNSHRQYEKDGSSRILFYEFECGSTTVYIQDHALNVDGKSYGTLNDGDTVAVNRSEVRVNSTPRLPLR